MSSRPNRNAFHAAGRRTRPVSILLAALACAGAGCVPQAFDQGQSRGLAGPNTGAPRVDWATVNSFAEIEPAAGGQHPAAADPEAPNPEAASAGRAVAFRGRAVEPLAGSESLLEACRPDAPGPDDQDGDGLADADETAGWTVTIYSGGNALSERTVTSDPAVADTDRDGICDSEEFAYLINPRRPDTDSDGLSDLDELRTWFSKPWDQDTDADGKGSPSFSDGSEVQGGTSPTLADTDGDGYLDRDEVVERSSDPLIADVPQAALDLVGEVAIWLHVLYTDQESFETTDEARLAREAARAGSRTDATIDRVTEEVTSEVSSEIGVDSDGLKASIGSKITSSTGYLHEHTTGWTQSSAQSVRDESARLLSEGRGRVEESSSGSISLGLKIRNTGDLTFTLKDLTVTVLQRDPERRNAFRVLTTLHPELGPDGVTLGPFNPESGIIQIEDADAPASLIKTLLTNPTGLFFEVAAFDLVDEAGRNFAFLAERTHRSTALVMIDFGDGRVESYRVATNVKRNSDGTSAGVTMREVMREVLEMPYETAQGDIVVGIDGTATTASEVVLRRVDGTPEVTSERRFWAVLGSDEEHVAPGLGFDDITLFGGDTLFLAFVSDQDGDGLFARQEFLFGTKDEREDRNGDGIPDGFDTDGDGLSDFHEVKVGWEVATDRVRTVFSEPRNTDADRDGLGDDEELAGVGVGVGSGPTDPNNPDTDGDGLCDGPGRFGNNNPGTALSPNPYYVCRNGNQDRKPLEPALTEPPALVFVAPPPNALAADRASKIITRFDQRMSRDSSFVVHGSTSGRLSGTFDYPERERGIVFTPDRPFEPGEEIEVSFTDDVDNIDNIAIEPFVYRFWAEVAATSTGAAFTPPVSHLPGPDTDLPVDYRARPFAIASGDFDGDGSVDLVRVNSARGGAECGGVGIMLNRGDGSFEDGMERTVWCNPDFVITGDFDLDGYLDLAVANDYAIAWLRNTGGIFEDWGDQHLGGSVDDLTTGDFDGDGALDLAAVVRPYRAAGKVSVLLNGGRGSFTAGVPYSAGGAPLALSSGDLDGDGMLDLAVADESDRVFILRNTGGGKFSAEAETFFRTGKDPSALATADLDGDGDVDLVTANRGSGDVSVLLNAGDGAFAPAVQYPAGRNPIALVAGDFDGDRALDLAIAEHCCDRVFVLLNDGNGAFGSPQPFTAGTWPNGVSAADFDGDGDLDLAVSNEDSHDVTVLSNEALTQ